MPTDLPLAGRVVGITAERRSEDQAVLFGRLGAEVVLAPAMHTSTLTDPDALRRATAEVIDAPPDFVVANTGTGIRAWMEAVREWGLEADLLSSLRPALIAARGPKAAAAISSSKLEVWWRSSSEQLTDVGRHLIESGVSGKRVAFQLHGGERSDFVSRLEAAGATVVPIPVYEWSAPSGEGAEIVAELIRRSCEGEIDAVTFTAGPQVRNLFGIAEDHGLATPLMEAFGRRLPLAACIGPVCAAVAAEEGIHDPVVPGNWRLGSLVKAVAAALLR